VSPTVHDNPRRTNLYVNFAQTIHDDQTPAHFSVHNSDYVLIPFWPFTCVPPILHPPDDEKLPMDTLRKFHILIIHHHRRFASCTC